MCGDEPSRGVPYTSDLQQAKFSRDTTSPLPAYRVMDGNGQVIDTQGDPKVRLNCGYKYSIHVNIPLKK